MKCPTCDRLNPEDAQFCIYCAARLTPPAAVMEATPATGPTKRLGEEAAPSYQMPAPPAAPSLPQRPSGRPRFGTESIGAIWLIGLGILFFTGEIFPGVLVLVGLTSYIKAAARGREQDGLRSFVFFGGLAAMFWFGWFWPLILVWVGAMILFNRGRGWHWC